MSRHPFEILDVFTRTPFAGNPLAVVHDADGLSDAAMQAIAREFNLSETVFVLPAESEHHTARLRIFTPQKELPFAGHPTVGAAVSLALGRVSAGAPRTAMVLALEEAVGPVRAAVTPEDARTGIAEFDAPRLPELFHAAPEAARVARALSLEPHEVGGQLPVSVASAGVAFTFVPVTSLSALERARPDRALFAETFEPDHAATYLFATGPVGGPHYRARMFAPLLGIEEDPATGAAVAALGAVLHGYGHLPDGEHVFRVEQGVEMGRTSEIGLEVSVLDGALHAVRLSGGAVRVAEGTIEA